MRRKDKEITDKEQIFSIMHEAKVCRVAMSEDDMPYIVPMNFGIKDNCLYLHSAKEGKKLNILKKNNRICFEVDIKNELAFSSEPCSWSMKYYSAIGFGEAIFVEEPKEKAKALNIIMEKYSGKSDYSFPDASLEKINIIKIKIESIRGKKSGY